MHVPDFNTTSSHGETISRDSLLGKSYILTFFNHVGSETCSKQTCSIRDGFSDLKNLGYVVFGVSEDNAKKQNKFIDKMSLPYSLIPDEDHVLASIFDIFGEKLFMGRLSDAVHRTTFIIDPQGIFKEVIHPINSSDHANQIVEIINA